MADVDDRGQLLLVGALTLAVMLVALAVLLNAAIYTGNVATRDAGPEAGAVIEYENEATSMVRDTIDALNEREDESYLHLRQNFTNTVGVWSDMARTHSAASLSDTAVESRNEPTEGTSIRQSSDRNFTSATEASNWTVANDSHARAFRMNVTQSSLLASDTPEVDGAFRVTFDDGTDVWKVYLHEGGTDNVSVTVIEPGGTEVDDGCTVDPGADDRAVLDVTGATLGDRACPELAFFDQLSGTYDVAYVASLNETGTEQIVGTYSLVVDRRIDQLETGADTTGASQPAASTAIYSADVELTYRTTDIFYQKNFTVAPGAADD